MLGGHVECDTVKKDLDNAVPRYDRVSQIDEPAAHSQLFVTGAEFWQQNGSSHVFAEEKNEGRMMSITMQVQTCLSDSSFRLHPSSFLPSLAISPAW
jgi:hypothetical protein